MKKAIYPGTFDPITFGHIDLIKKSLNIFDKVIVAVSDGNTKKYLFNAEEREQLIKKALFTDLKFSKKKIDTIQAIHSNKKVSIFHKPGMSDITYHVNFEDFIDLSKKYKINFLGPISQSKFLSFFGLKITTWSPILRLRFSANFFQ